MMATLTVAPGSWVPVRIAAGTASAQMAIGDEQPKPAYIENVRGRRDVETYAKRRCPDLRAGKYTVRVTTPNETVQIQLTVI